MALPSYTFGTFQLNDGTNYFVTDKKLGLPEVQESVFKVARYPGVKTTGTIINERRATVTVVVVGSSRADLESKVDVLLQALNQRQQQLAIHMLDDRYLVCDAISAPITYRATRLLAVTIQITFLAVDPYLYAATPSSYDSSSLAYALVSGSNWISGNLVVSSSGTEYAYPTLTLTNNSQAVNTTLSAALTSGNAYTSLSVAALPASAPAGTQFTLNDGTGHTQTVTLSAAAASGATTLSVTSFTANFSYPGTTTSCDYAAATITGFTLSQNPDGSSLQVSNLSWAPGQQITIGCDPRQANGYTVVSSAAPGTLIAFSGTFPVIEPTGTVLTLQVTASTQPIVDVYAIWTPRYLS